jgi:hypothetical protein
MIIQLEIGGDVVEQDGEAVFVRFIWKRVATLSALVSVLPLLRNIKCATVHFYGFFRSHILLFEPVAFIRNSLRSCPNIRRGFG